jgi:biopolymer transport protein ExbB
MSVMLQSGPVFWVIVGLGVVAGGIFFARLLHLRRAQIDYNDFLKGVCNVLENGNVEEAMMLCEETPGPVAAVTLTAIRHRQCARETLQEAVENTGRSEMSRLERRLAALAVICQIAPLLGLLGTILGASRVVMALNEQAPVVQSADLTAGIMQALAAAAAGLLVAIPCHVMHLMLIVRIERIVLEMEACASEIVAYLTKQDTSML